MKRSLQTALCMAILAVAFFISCPATAQQFRCAKSDLVSERLAQKHGEMPVALAPTHGGALMVRYATENGETWTLALRRTNGQTCLLAAGTDWQEREWKEPGGGT